MKRDADSLPSSAYDLSYQGDNKEESNCDEEENGDQGEEESDLIKIPSKFSLYQKSVQSPKGDISYLQKFFLMYVGGRFPLHFQEDFCGTALLSTEWLHSDPRRTSIGIDLDLEALTWCLNNNINKIGSDGYSRLSLFHGNVLQPSHAILVSSQLEFLVKTVSINENDKQVESTEAPAGILKDNYPLPARDIVCAFNYSCCCLQKRADLILYFKHAFGALSKKGGIFVMDLYGGTSSEHELRLQRTFPGFTYVWEQEEFDVISRTTRISLHFHVGKKKKQVMRHAFTYHWRLWSLPEVKDCLEEAGFRSIHFWIREMPDTREIEDCEEFDSGKDVKYEEVSSFPQRDAWNAYIVAVAN